jgi:hypothetical protein
VPDPGLPVDPDRLRRQFPSLTDDDLQAYVEVTRRILALRRAADRAGLTREILARGRQVRDQASADGPRSAEDALALRYLLAVAKMQGAVARPGKGRADTA